MVWKGGRGGDFLRGADLLFQALHIAAGLVFLTWPESSRLADPLALEILVSHVERIGLVDRDFSLAALRARVHPSSTSKGTMAEESQNRISERTFVRPRGQS